LQIFYEQTCKSLFASTTRPLNFHYFPQSIRYKIDYLDIQNQQILSFSYKIDRLSMKEVMFMSYNYKNVSATLDLGRVVHVFLHVCINEHQYNDTNVGF